jgi:spermidine/putrescine-binding protein
MKRREFLKNTAAMATAAAVGPVVPALAQAKPSQIVYMTWGGLWGNALKGSMDQAFEKETGVKLVQDNSGDPVGRIAKLKVNLNDQKYDLLALHDGNFPLAVKQGVLEKIDRSSARLTYLKELYPQMVHDYWVAHIFNAVGITYHKDLKNPPQSWADLWRPEFKGKIILPEVVHSIGLYIVAIGAMAAGKAPKDAETGFEMLKRMRDLKPLFVQDTDSIMNAFQSGEAQVGLLYKSQTFTIKDKGAPVEWAFPKEGAIEIAWGTGIAKNTKNLEWAERYLNVQCDAQHQTAFAHTFNYGGSNPKSVALLPPNLQERVRFSDDELQRMVRLDHDFMSDVRAEWTDRWSRIISG